MKINTNLWFKNPETDEEKFVVVKSPAIRPGTLLKGGAIIIFGVWYLVRSAFKKGVGAGLAESDRTLQSLGLLDVSEGELKDFEARF